MSGRFTHIDDRGRVRMVDVGSKDASDRRAVARAGVTMSPDTFARIRDRQSAKGNVLETARLAGIMAAKRTAELIPLCHPLSLTHVRVDFFPAANDSRIDIEAAARIHDRTGVEMEALTAVAVAALTIYDMCKAYDREMVISDIRLVEKSGGKSGHYLRNDQPDPPGD